MEVRCPNCSSLFNLPDSVRPGAKLRCSVCKRVFLLEAPAGQKAEEKAPQPQAQPAAGPAPETTPDTMDMDFSGIPPKKPLFKRLLPLLVFLVLAACGAGGWWYYVSIHKPEAPAADGLEKLVKELTLGDVRQYYVENAQLGKLFVIEGKVVNNSSASRDLVELEATLLDGSKKVLQRRNFYAGTYLSLFQMQVMSQKELETLLNNKIEILSNNTNVRSGDFVPFMTIFFTPPPTVAEFVVRVASARESQAEPPKPADAGPDEENAHGGKPGAGH